MSPSNFLKRFMYINIARISTILVPFESDFKALSNSTKITKIRSQQDNSIVIEEPWNVDHFASQQSGGMNKLFVNPIMFVAANNVPNLIRKPNYGQLMILLCSKVGGTLLQTLKLMVLLREMFIHSLFYHTRFDPFYRRINGI